MSSSLKDFDFSEVYAKWQQLARKFGCFVHTTSFTTLKNYPNFTLDSVNTDTDSHTASILEFIQPYLDPHTLFFIDMPLASALKYAYFFNRDFKMLPVLTMRHLHHPYGLVGDKNSISALLKYTDLIGDVDEPSPMYLFILDSSRYSTFSEDVYKIQFNNQYRLTEYNLPPFDMLRENGIEKVVFLNEKAPKDDMLQYMNSLVKEDFGVVNYDIATNEVTASNFCNV